mgnify:CR=1 FL=1
MTMRRGWHHMNPHYHHSTKDAAPHSRAWHQTSRSRWPNKIKCDRPSPALTRTRLMPFKKSNWKRRVQGLETIIQLISFRDSQLILLVEIRNHWRQTSHLHLKRSFLGKSTYQLFVFGKQFKPINYSKTTKFTLNNNLIDKWKYKITNLKIWH